MEEVKMYRLNSEACKVVVMLISIIGGLGFSAVASAERGMGKGGMGGGMYCGQGMHAAW